MRNTQLQTNSGSTSPYTMMEATVVRKPCQKTGVNNAVVKAKE